MNYDQDDENFNKDYIKAWGPILEEGYRVQKIEQFQYAVKKFAQFIIGIVATIASLATIWAVFFK